MGKSARCPLDTQTLAWSPRHASRRWGGGEEGPAFLERVMRRRRASLEASQPPFSSSLPAPEQETFTK